MQGLQAYMENCGLPIYEEPILDGNYHRYSCRPESPEKRDEWYRFVQKEHGGVVFFTTFRLGAAERTYCYDPKGGLKISEEEIRRNKAEIQKIIEENRVKTERAEREIAMLLCRLPEATADHPYLKRKKIKPHGILQHNERLFIPIKTLGNKAIGVEYINENGEKSSLTGGHRKGGVFVFGEPDRKIFVCEGFATAATVYEATGVCTVCAFSSNNILLVAHALKARYLKASIELCADTGSDKLIASWKQEISDTVHIPTFSREELASFEKADNLDFNDMLKFHTKKEIADLLQKYYEPEGICEHYERKKEPFTWIVEDLIARKSITMIFGQAGCGKSLISFDLAFCISNGISFFTYNIPKKHNILYIDGEMSSDEIDLRFDSVIERYNPDGNASYTFDNDRFKILTIDKILEDGKDTIDLFSSKSREMLSKAIAWSDVVIFDHLSDLTKGGDTGDDTLNDAASWSKVSGWFKEIKSMGKAVIFIHHANKMNDASGTNALKANPQTIIQLRQPKDEDRKENHFQVLFSIEKGRHVKDKRPRLMSMKNEVDEDKKEDKKILGGWL